MANELQGRGVAILLAPKGTEQAEFVQPKKVPATFRRGAPNRMPASTAAEQVS